MSFSLYMTVKTPNPLGFLLSYLPRILALSKSRYYYYFYITILYRSNVFFIMGTPLRLMLQCPHCVLPTERFLFRCERHQCAYLLYS